MGMAASTMDMDTGRQSQFTNGKHVSILPRSCILFFMHCYCCCVLYFITANFLSFFRFIKLVPDSQRATNWNNTFSTIEWNIKSQSISAVFILLRLDYMRMCACLHMDRINKIIKMERTQLQTSSNLFCWFVAGSAMRKLPLVILCAHQIGCRKYSTNELQFIQRHKFIFSVSDVIAFKFSARELLLLLCGLVAHRRVFSIEFH